MSREDIWVEQQTERYNRGEISQELYLKIKNSGHLFPGDKEGEFYRWERRKSKNIDRENCVLGIDRRDDFLIYEIRRVIDQFPNWIGCCRAEELCDMYEDLREEYKKIKSGYEALVRRAQVWEERASKAEAELAIVKKNS